MEHGSLCIVKQERERKTLTRLASLLTAVVFGAEPGKATAEVTVEDYFL
jgi:hypothetical protein